MIWGLKHQNIAIVTSGAIRIFPGGYSHRLKYTYTKQHLGTKKGRWKQQNYIFGSSNDLGQEYYAPQVRPNQGQNSYQNVHIMTVPFHVTETPTLTT